MRLFGAVLNRGSATVRAGVRLLLLTSIACVAGFAVKDAWLMIPWWEGRNSPLTLSLILLRLAPLYAIPAVLLWDYYLAERQAGAPRLLLVPDRTACGAIALAASAAVITAALAAHRQSDATVRRLVSDHRPAIHAAGERYDVDPRLIAAIVYVTHREQL
jgi:hypothetical protein